MAGSEHYIDHRTYTIVRSSRKPCLLLSIMYRSAVVSWHPVLSPPDPKSCASRLSARNKYALKSGYKVISRGNKEPGNGTKGYGAIGAPAKVTKQRSPLQGLGGSTGRVTTHTLCRCHHLLRSGTSPRSSYSELFGFRVNFRLTMRCATVERLFSD